MGVPVTHHRLTEVRAKAALAVLVFLSLMVWASSRITRNQLTSKRAAGSCLGCLLSVLLESKGHDYPK